MKLSLHFSDSEFKCKCHSCTMPEISKELLEVLEDVRANYGGKVIITSGYRCKAHNEKVGGAPKSKHCEGIAADISVTDEHGVIVAPRSVASYLDDIYPEKYGIGKYKNWVHIDVRKERVRWTG